MLKKIKKKTINKKKMRMIQKVAKTINRKTKVIKNEEEEEEDSC